MTRTAKDKTIPAQQGEEPSFIVQFGEGPGARQIAIPKSASMQTPGEAMRLFRDVADALQKIYEETSRLQIWITEDMFREVNRIPKGERLEELAKPPLDLSPRGEVAKLAVRVAPWARLPVSLPDWELIDWGPDTPLWAELAPCMNALYALPDAVETGARIQKEATKQRKLSRMERADWANAVETETERFWLLAENSLACLEALEAKRARRAAEDAKDDLKSERDKAVGVAEAKTDEVEYLRRKLDKVERGKRTGPNYGDIVTAFRELDEKGWGGSQDGLWKDEIGRARDEGWNLGGAWKFQKFQEMRGKWNQWGKPDAGKFEENWKAYMRARKRKTARKPQSGRG